MRKWTALFLFLVACSSSPKLHRLAICAMFKNEAIWLKEWITYHHKVLGVERFYLYNNDSSDDYRQVLEPFIAEGIVELIDWDSQDPDHLAGDPAFNPQRERTQIGAYNDCLKKRALGRAKWVAMIDIDEFIVPVHGVKRFYERLAREERHHKGTISLRWRVFGTSGVEKLEENELLIEKLDLRAEDAHPWNELVKSIHRPEAIEFCIIHFAEKLKPGFGARTLKGDEARINHYWTRTEEFLINKRLGGNESGLVGFNSFNEIHDTTIHQYLPVMTRNLPQ